MQNRKNYTLALDPNLSETGYALMSGEDVIACGTLKLSAALTESFRLNKLAEGLKHLIHKFSPRELAIEVPFVGRNAKTAIKLGGARGVILELAEASGLAIYEYTTFEIKRAVTSDHCACKEQVSAMVVRVTGIKTNNYNISDAIAVGLCHATCKELKETPEKMESTPKGKGGVCHVL